MGFFYAGIRARGRAVAGLYVCLHEVLRIRSLLRGSLPLYCFSLLGRSSWLNSLTLTSGQLCLAMLCLSVMTVRDYFSRFFLPAFLAPWHRPSACDCRITATCPVARLTLPLPLFRFVRFQGEGPILYIVFLALDFSFFTSGLAFFCRCLRIPPQIQTHRPLGAASMTGFTPALRHPMSRSSGLGG